MNYIIVLKLVNGEHYVSLTDDCAINGFTSKEEVMNAFKGYTERWGGRGCSGMAGAENAASATIGMMQINPIAIKAPDDINDLKKYILSMKPYLISGGVIGNHKGMKVSADILELKEFEIWDESMRLGGIKA